jgi:hypothetical protein
MPANHSCRIARGMHVPARSDGSAIGSCAPFTFGTASVRLVLAALGTGAEVSAKDTCPVQALVRRGPPRPLRSASVEDAGRYIMALFSPRTLVIPTSVASTLTAEEALLFLVAFASLALSAGFVTGRFVSQQGGRGVALARAAIVVIALPLAISLIARGSFSPFLYFQF